MKDRYLTIIVAAWVFVGLLAAAGPATASMMAQDSGDMAQDEAPAEAPIEAKVVKINGRSAQYRVNPDDAWQPLEEGMVLPVGAAIRTGLRTTVDIQTGPNADVTLKGPAAIFYVGQLERDGDTLRTKLFVERGKIDVKVKHVGFANDFKVQTPTGTMAVQGTDFICETYGGTRYIGDLGNGPDAMKVTDNGTGQEQKLTGNMEYEKQPGETKSGDQGGIGNKGYSNQGDKGGGKGSGGGDDDGGSNAGVSGLVQYKQVLTGVESNMQSMQEFEKKTEQRGNLTDPGFLDDIGGEL